MYTIILTIIVKDNFIINISIININNDGNNV